MVHTGALGALGRWTNVNRRARGEVGEMHHSTNAIFLKQKIKLDWRVWRSSEAALRLLFTSYALPSGKGGRQAGEQKCCRAQRWHQISVD